MTHTQSGCKALPVYPLHVTALQPTVHNRNGHSQCTRSGNCRPSLMKNTCFCVMRCAEGVRVCVTVVTGKRRGGPGGFRVLRLSLQKPGGAASKKYMRRMHKPAQTQNSLGCCCPRGPSSCLNTSRRHEQQNAETRTMNPQLREGSSGQFGGVLKGKCGAHTRLEAQA